MRNEDHRTSGDNLDDYIRVSSPRLLIIVGILSLVLIATVVWGIFGKIPVTMTVTGCVVEDTPFMTEQGQVGHQDIDTSEWPWIICYVDASKYDAEQIQRFANDVTITMPDHTVDKGKIEYVSPQPLSKDEALAYLKDSAWVVDQCVTSNYSWGIVIHVHEDISNHLFTTPDVTITIDEISPIRFLTR